MDLGKLENHIFAFKGFTFFQDTFNSEGRNKDGGQGQKKKKTVKNVDFYCIRCIWRGVNGCVDTFQWRM